MFVLSIKLEGDDFGAGASLLVDALSDHGDVQLASLWTDRDTGVPVVSSSRQASAMMVSGLFVLDNPNEMVPNLQPQQWQTTKTSSLSPKFNTAHNYASTFY